MRILQLILYFVKKGSLGALGVLFVLFFMFGEFLGIVGNGTLFGFLGD